jgi:hypothetical protein
MSQTISLPLNPPVPAWFRMNNEWQKVTAVRIIQRGGFASNLIKLADGTEKTVPNDKLRFGPKPRS